MKKLPIDLVFFAVLAVLALAALEIFVRTTDATKFRPQLTEMLAEKVGRAVKIDGPIAFSLGFGGIKISMGDVSTPNPKGAHAPLSASVGKLELNLGLLSTLTGHFFDDVSIEDAEVLLETNKISVDKAPAAASRHRTFLRFQDLKITNSKITFLDANGKRVEATIASLALKMHLRSAELVMNGDIDGVPVTADIKTSQTNLLGTAPFSVDVVATYDIVHLAALGKVDIAGRNAELSPIEIEARDTKVMGSLEANWAPARPVLHGIFNSNGFDLADFKPGPPKKGGDAAGITETPDHSRLFGSTPLPLEVLGAFDADVAIAVGEFPVGLGALEQLKATLILADGNLTLSPFEARVGASPIDAMIVLNASRSPAHVDIGMVAKEVDLGDLQKLAGMSPFITGKAGVYIRLGGDGNSARDVASSLGGVITVTAGKGEIASSGVAAQISSMLASAFASGASTSALNCLSARFVVKNGIAFDNGILIDSAASTIAGRGRIDFGQETVAMSLRARTKLTGPMPPVHIEGDLKDLRTWANPVNIVKHVVGSLIDADTDEADLSVPEIQEAPAGQNVCVYTLNHPGANASSTGSAADLNRASEKFQNIGNAVINGLLLDSGGNE